MTAVIAGLFRWIASRWLAATTGGAGTGGLLPPDSRIWRPSPLPRGEQKKIGIRMRDLSTLSPCMKRGDRVARSSAVLQGLGDCVGHPVGRSYECAVREMGVACGHARDPMTQKARDRQLRKAQFCGCCGKAVAQDVDRDIIEAGSGANTIQDLRQANEMAIALVGGENPGFSSRKDRLSRSRIAAAPSGQICGPLLVSPNLIH